MYRLYLDGKTTAGGKVFETYEQAKAYVDNLIKVAEAKAKQIPQMKIAVMDAKRIQITKVS